MADVQILMATRNGAEFLPAQLSSIAAQTARNWHLLVSDDGSGDSTRRVLGSFARQTGRLTLVEGPEMGAAANFLSLLARSNSDVPYVALSDQDDVWFPRKLERALGALQRFPSRHPVIYAAHSQLIDAKGRRGALLKRANAPEPTFANALVQNILPGHTIVLNRAAADLARRVMPRHMPPFHDWWLYALMAGHGAVILLDKQAVLGYRQHQSSLLGAAQGPLGQLKRAGMVLDGTWRDWLADHHAALASVSAELKPNFRQQLAAIVSAQGHVQRIVALRNMAARRQGRIGTAGLHLATLAGLA